MIGSCNNRLTFLGLTAGNIPVNSNVDVSPYSSSAVKTWGPDCSIGDTLKTGKFATVIYRDNTAISHYIVTVLL